MEQPLFEEASATVKTCSNCGLDKIKAKNRCNACYSWIRTRRRCHRVVEARTTHLLYRLLDTDPTLTISEAIEIIEANIREEVIDGQPVA